MGVNLSIVLDHPLQASEVVLLADRVNESSRMRLAAEQLWTVMKPRWRNLGPIDSFASLIPKERLSAEGIESAWASKDAPSFEWAGFSVYVGRRVLEATHIEKLTCFVLNLEELREPLRACALALADELGSTQIMYGPDSASPFEFATEGMWEGLSFQEILAGVGARCGPPAENIRGMAGDDEEGALLALWQSCYFVESVRTS